MSISLPILSGGTSSFVPSSTPSLPTTTSSTTTSSSSTTTSTPTSQATTSSSTSSTPTPTSSAPGTSNTPSSTTSTSNTSTTSKPTDTSSSTQSTTSTTFLTVTSLTRTEGGGTQFETVTLPNGASPTQSASNSNSTSTTSSFFQNKGEVAGVFSVVGVLGLVIIIALATNAIRRRRAKKFDEDVAAAAAEAAKAPRYPFDDYDDPGLTYGVGSTYSDPESQGTLSQPPMSHGGESYNMSEYPGYAAPLAYGAGAAGIGAVAAGGMNRSRSYKDTSPSEHGGYGVAGLGANPAAMRNAPGAPVPYNAFAVPSAPLPGDPFYAAGIVRQKSSGSRSGQDLLEAAGLAGTGNGGHLARGPSQSSAAALSRKQSQGTRAYTSSDYTSGSDMGGAARRASSHGHESYAAHYQPDFRPNEYTYQPTDNGVGVPLASVSESDALPNPFASGGLIANSANDHDNSDEEAYGVDSYVPVRPALHTDETRMSIRDEDDYGRAGRTLKVANE